MERKTDWNLCESLWKLRAGDLKTISVCYISYMFDISVYFPRDFLKNSNMVTSKSRKVCLEKQKLDKLKASTRRETSITKTDRWKNKQLVTIFIIFHYFVKVCEGFTPRFATQSCRMPPFLEMREARDFDAVESKAQVHSVWTTVAERKQSLDVIGIVFDKLQTIININQHQPSSKCRCFLTHVQ